MGKRENLHRGHWKVRDNGMRGEWKIGNTMRNWGTNKTNGTRKLKDRTVEHRK